MQSLQHYARLVIHKNDVDYSHLPPHMYQGLGLPEPSVYEALRIEYTKKYWKPYSIKDPKVGLLMSAELGCLNSLMFFKSIGANNIKCAMSIAALYGHIEVVKRCKEFGADNYNGSLNSAASSGHVDVVLLLKEYGANQFNYALRIAAQHGHTEVFKLVMRWVPPPLELHPFWEGASLFGRYDMVKLLIELDPDCNCIDKGMESATLYNHVDVIRLCKENGGKNFKPVYLLAATLGHIEIIKMCKEWNVIDDIDAVLCNASHLGRTDVVKLSKEYGAVEFEKAYDLACEYHGFFPHTCDKSRIERRALIDLLKEWKDTHFDWLLNKAASKGDIELLQESKEKGAVNYNTAMRCAAAEGHIEIVLILKEWGADDFVIAAQEAAKNGHIEILKLFREWGLTDYDNAMAEAISAGNIEILKLFREWGVCLPNKDFHSFRVCSSKIRPFLLDWKASLVIPPSPILQS